MAKVTFKKSGPLLVKVHIDGRNVRFKGDTAEVNASPGWHAVNWFVRGEPGASYSIAVTAPKEAKFSHKAHLDSAQKDAGLRWIEVAE